MIVRPFYVSAREARWIYERLDSIVSDWSSLKRERLMMNMFLRRSAGEPLQYVMADQPFNGLSILCKKGTLVPRWETEEWSAALARSIISGSRKSKHLSEVTSRGFKILDLCSGSGCIALSLARQLSAAFPVAARKSSESKTKVVERLEDKVDDHRKNWSALDYWAEQNLMEASAEIPSPLEELKEIARLSEEPCWEVTGVDASPQAVRLAQLNTDRNLEEGDMPVQFLRGDIVLQHRAALGAHTKFNASESELASKADKLTSQAGNATEDADELAEDQGDSTNRTDSSAHDMSYDGKDIIGDMSDRWDKVMDTIYSQRSSRMRRLRDRREESYNVNFARALAGAELVVSNAPYIPQSEFLKGTSRSVREFEPRRALLGLSEDGAGFYRAICRLMRMSAVRAFGCVFEVCHVEQASEVVEMIHAILGWRARVCTDSSGRARTVVGINPADYRAHLLDDFKGH